MTRAAVRLAVLLAAMAVGSGLSVFLSAQRQTSTTEYLDNAKETAPLGSALVYWDGVDEMVAVSSANPLPVSGITITGGDASAANQATMITHLADIADGAPVTNAGTFAVQVTGDALTSLQLTDNLVLAEDGIHSSGESGLLALVVRQDSHTDLAADGDRIPLTVDADGGLRVSIVAGAGSGGTAVADDADFTDGTTSGTPVGGVAESASPTTVTEGDFGWAAITLNRALKVALYKPDGTAVSYTGVSALKYTSAGSSEDEHAVKASAGTLYSITATNTNAAARYLRCENDTAANTTPGSETPELDLAIPGAAAGAGITFSLPAGYAFSAGLTCWVVTGAADTDVAEVAANEIKLFYTFE